MFSDVSSLEHKNVPVVKEVEMINFSSCNDVNENILWRQKWNKFLL